MKKCNFTIHASLLQSFAAASVLTGGPAGLAASGGSVKTDAFGSGAIPSAIDFADVCQPEDAVIAESSGLPTGR